MLNASALCYPRNESIWECNPHELRNLHVVAEIIHTKERLIENLGNVKKNMALPQGKPWSLLSGCFVNRVQKRYYALTMATTLFSSLTEQDKSTAVKRIIDESTPRDDFFLMTVLAVAMATLGLLLNSVVIIIGSMLIAPLLSPIMGISLGIVMADSKLIYRSLRTLGRAMLFTIPTAAIFALLFTSQSGLTGAFNQEILERTAPNVINILIAVIAGLAASFALIKPELNATLPGVAISVSLIPPLAVTGIGLAKLNWTVMTDSFILFLINVIAIVFANMVVFSLMHFYVKRSVAEKEIAVADKQLAEDREKARKEVNE